MSLINHVEGDATSATHGAIIHIVNDIGAWGSGFVIAVSRRWVAPEQAYRALSGRAGLALGTNQVVPVDTGLSVVNMIAQRGVSRSVRAVSYDALDLCLADLYENVVPTLPHRQVHAPLIGAGLGGGDWDVIQQIIEAHADVLTTIWHLPHTGRRA